MKGNTKEEKVNIIINWLEIRGIESFTNNDYTKIMYYDTNGEEHVFCEIKTGILDRLIDQNNMTKMEIIE